MVDRGPGLHGDRLHPGVSATVEVRSGEYSTLGKVHMHVKILRKINRGQLKICCCGVTNMSTNMAHIVQKGVTM